METVGCVSSDLRSSAAPNAAGRSPFPRRFTGYDAVRTVLGILLLAAALLKGYQLATEPTVGQSLLESRWFVIALVEFELLFGLWLLSGIYPILSWHIAAVCFVSFAGVSLFKALSGEASCGCFGRVSVNPWLTFALDLAVLAAILRSYPDAQEPLVQSKTDRRWLAILLAGWAIAGMAVLLFLVRSSEIVASELGDALPGGRGVALRPERWVGRPLPLLHSIDLDARLSQGRWIVVLYHFDCPACREALARYRRLADEFQASDSDVRVALIKVPPYASLDASAAARASSAVHGRLGNATHWSIRTPTELTIEDGMVLEVR